MEAGTRICPRCGLRRLTETECPACGSTTHQPNEQAAAEAVVPAAPQPSYPVGGLAIAVLGAGGLLASLSMPWYAFDLPSGLRGLFEGPAEQFGLREAARGLEATGWEAFEVIDVALAAAAGATFMLVAAALMGRLRALDATRLLQGIGGVVIGVTAFRMIDQPDPSEFLKLQPGAWVALVSGAAIVLGSGLTVSRAR